MVCMYKRVNKVLLKKLCTRSKQLDEVPSEQRLCFSLLLFLNSILTYPTTLLSSLNSWYTKQPTNSRPSNCTNFTFQSVLLFIYPLHNTTIFPFPPYCIWYHPIIHLSLTPLIILPSPTPLYSRTA